MTKKIGVITTGGTIGSILSGDAMAVDPREAVVQHEIQSLCRCHGFDVEVRSAFNKNSEDLTPEDWGVLIQAVHQMRMDGIDRIVVTHGTDTLAYSAAALGLVFRETGIRLCLTGSFYALEAEGSDGPLNLLAAFHTVSNDAIPTGVYVAFRQDAANHFALIHDALAVKPMAFDDVAFRSVGGQHVGVFKPDRGVEISNILPTIHAPNVSHPNVNPSACAQSTRDILCMEHYPGLPWQRLDDGDLRLLLIGLYHSGTGHARAGDGALTAFLNSKRADLQVIAATFPANAIEVPYESTAKLCAAGMHIVKELPLHVLYVFSVLESAAGQPVDTILKKLKPWLLTKTTA